MKTIKITVYFELFAKNNAIDKFSVPCIEIYLMAFVFFKSYILISFFLHNRFVKFTLFVTVYKFIQ